MLKTKYLHRKSRDTKYSQRWDIRKYQRGKNVDFYSDALSTHEPIRSKYTRNVNIDTYPVYKFIESKIGCDWNDVYSEIISKTKKKFRQEIDFQIAYYVVTPNYYLDYIPYGSIGRWGRRDYILNDTIYIDMDNILRRKTLEELELDAKKLMRRDKLLEIMENQKQEDQELSS